MCIAITVARKRCQCYIRAGTSRFKGAHIHPLPELFTLTLPIFFMVCIIDPPFLSSSNLLRYGESEWVKVTMITAIVINMSGEAQIRRYDTNNPREARDWFVQEWIDGRVIWKSWEFYGPNCTAKAPAFSPDFLQESGFGESLPELLPASMLNVTVYQWCCITGPHGSDEHIVIGYFVLDPFEKPPMITAIVVDGNGQPQIRRYETDNHRTARDSFVREWIDGGVVWEYEEFAGPNCTAKVPAFSPDFLRRTGFTDNAPKVVLNVFIYEWRCATGPRYSDQHCVSGYFVLDL
jgi:hypothetical protein